MSGSCRVGRVYEGQFGQKSSLPFFELEHISLPFTQISPPKFPFLWNLEWLWDAITGGNSARVIAREAVIANSQFTAAQHMERERAYDIIASVLKIRFLDEEVTNRQYTQKMARVDAFPSPVKDRKEIVIPWTEVFEKGMCLSLANMK
ncbi:actin-related protein 9 [Dorcoceras hygrometricum]|uniref:Actin-related protein 9 n=1 Tax=Dorcoceras hygrometricum TaxID=472368 RepID=A0A2Z7BLK8_9LAMI|nr:actin-related protein 9 [Dorcoceras hygrometricum]